MQVELVRRVIAIEPTNGPPVARSSFDRPPDPFGDIGQALQDLRPRLVPWHTIRRSSQARERAIRAAGNPDAPDLVRGWLQKAPARQLPNLAKIPMLIVAAEASYHAAFDHCTAAYLKQAGVPATFLRLEDAGIRGNGHMMMLEKNSDEIAGVLVDWLKKALVKKPTRRKR